MARNTVRKMAYFFGADSPNSIADILILEVSIIGGKE
jgi:hypothetical protein